jgi:hypothetical protein
MPLTYRQRKRLPKLREIALVWRTLSSLFPMDDVRHGWRESLRDVVNYRIRAITNGQEWFLDIYHGGYYVVTTGSRFPEPCKSLPSAVWYLCRMLEVRKRNGQ